MNKLNKLMTGSLLFVASAQAGYRLGDQDKWPSHTLQFTKNWSLKDGFDSGLRLYRFPGLENSLLEQKHLKIEIIQQDGIRLPIFNAELMSMSVYVGGFISSIEIEQEPMTLSDSRLEMLRWIKFGKTPIRTEPELDEFLRDVGKDFREYNGGAAKIGKDFSLAWRDSDQTRYVVWFQSARNPITPLAVHMAIRFPLKSRQETSYDGPIPPPPGYEDVDMNAPKDFGPDSPPPDPELGRVMKAGVLPDEASYETGRLTLREILHKIRDEDKTADAPQTTQRFPWRWWVVGGLVVIMIVYKIKFSRK